MKTIIAGGRDLWITQSHLTSVIAESGFNITEVVSGACLQGIDICGEVWAKSARIPLTLFPAD